VSDGAPERWNAAVAALHLLGACAVLGLLTLGFYMTLADLDAASKFDLYQWHKTIGWLTLMLTLARVATRSLTTAPLPLSTIPPRMRALARATHFALYALTLIAGLTGWVRISSAIVPIPIDLFGLASVPDIAPMNAELSDAMSRVHGYVAYGLAALVALHVVAALKHHFVDGDATLRRMIRGR
jgi:cytochrome b561